MKRYLTLTAWLALAALVLAACSGSGPANDDGATDPSYSQEAFQVAVDDFGDDAADVGAQLEADLGAQALVAMPPGAPIPFGTGTAPLGDGLGALAAAIRPLADANLPRGTYQHDPLAPGWTRTDTSEDLVLAWSYDDAQGSSHDAVLTFDWNAGGPTEEVADVDGGTAEVPTDMNVSLTVDGGSAADFDVELDWYSAGGCPDGTIEPTRVWIDGSAGIYATVTLDEVRFATDEDTISTSGDVAVVAGSDSAGFAWDVTATGSVVRGPDCELREFEAESGSVDLSTFSDVAGPRHGFGIAFDFDDLVVDAATGSDSVELRNGAVTVDGATAVAFAGTLDDADGNGVPGDAVTLTFAGGASTTLEAFIEEGMTATAGVARVLSVLR